MDGVCTWIGSSPTALPDVMERPLQQVTKPNQSEETPDGNSSGPLLTRVSKCARPSFDAASAASEKGVDEANVMTSKSLETAPTEYRSAPIRTAARVEAESTASSSVNDVKVIEENVDVCTTW